MYIGGTSMENDQKAQKESLIFFGHSIVYEVGIHSQHPVSHITANLNPREGL